MLAEKLLKPPSAVANYIEDVFSTYLYTGTSGYKTITNGIDLATKGGLIWLKDRTNPYGAATDNVLFSTADITKYLTSNTTDAYTTQSVSLAKISSVNTDGFECVGSTIGANTNTYASWTFRKQPKFFDCGTYTGTGSNRTVPHNLGSTPGVIIVKQTSASGRGWVTYHRSLGATKYVYLDANYAEDTWSIVWNNTAPTSTEFTVGTFAGVNESGQSYVYYAFAHDAGGFGLTGTDNVISCGSYTGNGGTRNVNLGYEPQWVMVKRSDSTGNWNILDTMRGWTVGDSVGCQQLYANTSGAEVNNSFFGLTSTGFGGNNGDIWNTSGATYIYIAIRRGPMKVPTDATKVFSPNVSSASTGTKVTTSFPVDLQIQSYRAGPDNNFVDRLRGVSSTSTAAGPYLRSTTTAAEAGTNSTLGWDNTGFQITAGFSGADTAYWNFQRAPNFFDEVCTTADSSGNLSFTHNLGVAPELVIMKARSGAARSWYVYSAGVTHPNSTYMQLNTNDAAADFYPTYTYYSVSSTTFTTYTGGWAANNGTAVAYLFASCPGVSKVGSYTGNGTNQTINCGFAGGARFVLIKRTDNTGGWYVYDTARGMTTLVDPYLFLNSTAAEAATLGSVTTVTTGFKVDASILAAVNTNAATYIYLAIA